VGTGDKNRRYVLPQIVELSTAVNIIP